MIRVRVLLFAQARDLAGTGQADIDLPDGAAASDLLQHLLGLYPGLASVHAQLLLAVNRSYATAGTILHSGDEVAVIPPVSGG